MKTVIYTMPKRVFYLLFLLLPLTIRAQLNSFQSFSENDFLYLNSAIETRANSLRFGIEGRLRDYDYIYSDNEFQASLLLGATLFNRLQLDLRLPRQWSWAVPMRDAITHPENIRTDGFEDYSATARLITTRYPIVPVALSLGGRWMRSTLPRFADEEITYRDDAALLVNATSIARRCIITGEFLYTLIDVQNKSALTFAGQDYLLSAGLGGSYLLRPRLQIIGEYAFEQGLPKFLDKFRQAPVQNWHSFTLGAKLLAGNHLTVRAALTTSFRNRISLDFSDDNTGSFNLAKALLQIVYSL